MSDTTGHTAGYTRPRVRTSSDPLRLTSTEVRSDLTYLEEELVVPSLDHPEQILPLRRPLLPPRTRDQ